MDMGKKVNNEAGVLLNKEVSAVDIDINFGSISAVSECEKGENVEACTDKSNEAELLDKVEVSVEDDDQNKQDSTSVGNCAEDDVISPTVSNSNNSLDKEVKVNTDGPANKSYAYVANKNVPVIDNKLKTIPTEIDENGYARVLVEVQAKKGLPDKIDIKYRNSFKEVIGQKSVQVKYDWTPPICTECNVFGHNNSQCNKACTGTNSTDKGKEVDCNKEDSNDDGFIGVAYKRTGKNNNVVNKPNNQNIANKPNNQNKKFNTNGGYGNKTKTVYEQKKVNVEKTAQVSTAERITTSTVDNNKKYDSTTNGGGKKKSMVKTCTSMSNQFAALEDYEEGEMLEIQSMSEREKVDYFIRIKKWPSNEESKDWSTDMFGYFRKRWELIVDVNGQNVTSIEEDVYSVEEGIAKEMNVGDIRGMDRNVLHDC
ncbi:hypothetical protein CTI12_AA224370 [Artemisia annua]|uniref:ATPase, F1/V1/A1 complex, alpha/beta subunit, Zinc knuckle CX2CX4HX4C n=1 Tax=Artemisia annua TaxID=35608 RepID=A0A2U1NV76_ARTAN|nr:hypothetical protein CTI12_AA224370 [Artemisia annua]